MSIKCSFLFVFGLLCFAGFTVMAIIFFEPRVSIANLPMAARIVIGFLATSAAAAVLFLSLLQLIESNSGRQSKKSSTGSGGGYDVTAIGKASSAAAAALMKRTHSGTRIWVITLSFVLLLLGSAVAQNNNTDSWALAYSIFLICVGGGTSIAFFIWELKLVNDAHGLGK